MPKTNNMEPVKAGTINIIDGPMFGGKCHPPGTKILMYDGTIKNVEDIKQGDFLMGDDSKPRTVLSTSKGFGPMFEIQTRLGEVYGVNDAHILSLKCLDQVRKIQISRDSETGGSKLVWLQDHQLEQRNFDTFGQAIDFGHNVKPQLRGGDTLDIPLNEYLQKSDAWKKFYGGYSVGVEFPDPKPLPINPYLLGLWLVCGSPTGSTFSHGHREVLDYLFDCAGELDLCLTKGVNGLGCMMISTDHKNNKFTDFLETQNLVSNKHIPHAYKTSSRKDRLLLLAGILDGERFHRRFPNSCTIELSPRNLADDFCFLARSLGFRIQEPESPLWNVFLCTILGNLAEIPTLLPEDQGNIFPDSDSVTQFDVKQVADGDYYGFTLDGNGRYLLSTFTVTHNTSELQRRFKIHKLANSKRKNHAPILLIRYAEDDPRYCSDGLSTHDRVIIKDSYDVVATTNLSEVLEIAKPCCHIYIDEGQFFKDLKDYCVTWARQGKDVTVACLDAHGNPPHFDPWPEIVKLVPFATKREKYSAICFNCGEPAPITIALDKSNEPTTKIGGSELFRASCIMCCDL
jgi:thymidine kinase